ncbi:Ribonuclease Z [Spathaspora sp. JA1]|nr:Ribonuclease Z [Spathaspora sp. JA1]
MFTVTTLTHITDETSRPLIALTTKEGNRYFFGKVPEGTQRILNFLRWRFPKLEGVFISGTISSWSDIGGLPGLFLTISDATKKSITVFGNSRVLSFIVATWRWFVFRKGIELRITETQENAIYADNEISVTPIRINNGQPLRNTPDSSLFSGLRKLASLMFPLDTSKVNSRDPDSYKSDPWEIDLHTHVRIPPSSAFFPIQQDSYSYAIRLLPVRGKFDTKKAIALGIKPGPLFSELIKGRSVTNDAGEIINPDQVIAPSREFAKVLVIDIPNQSYYLNTINSNEWFVKDESRGFEEIGLVYHFLGQDVEFDLEQYKLDFLNKFPPDARHVISHASITNNVLINKRFEVASMTLKAVMNEQYNLPNQEDYVKIPVDESIVRLHGSQAFKISPSGVEVDNSLVDEGSKQQLFESEVAPLNLSKSLEELNNVSFNLSKDQDEELSLKDRVHICTLGTGSAIPSIYRNVISTLVRIPLKNPDGTVSYRAILLDGGENTIGSFWRTFGHANKTAAIQILKELSVIHLSHLHADHHLGIVSMISEWFKYNNNDKKLYLIVPSNYMTFIQDWYSLEANYNEDFDMNRLECFTCEDFLAERRIPESSKVSLQDFEIQFDLGNIHQPVPYEPLSTVDFVRINELYESVGLESVSTVRAIHCFNSYSSIFKFRLGDNETFQLSYSGDTRPNPKFAEVGFGSDLLVHEASLENFLIEEALAKKHSTMIEAVCTSKIMECPKIILTHFSSRYGNSNNCIAKHELQQSAKSLDEYLTNHHADLNIFSHDTSLTTEYKDLDLCFAFDWMNVRYGELHLQEQHWDKLSELFESSMIKDPDEERVEEKQAAKRLGRLEKLAKKNSKKQRVSDETI